MKNLINFLLSFASVALGVNLIDKQNEQYSLFALFFLFSLIVHLFKSKSKNPKHYMNRILTGLWFLTLVFAFVATNWAVNQDFRYTPLVLLFISSTGARFLTKTHDNNWRRKFVIFEVLLALVLTCIALGFCGFTFYLTFLGTVFIAVFIDANEKRKKAKESINSVI